MPWPATIILLAQVLNRLRQKQSEWRGAQRQWNRVWREVNERNFLKSLDYKMAHFKKQDPIACKPKTLKQAMRDRRDAYRAQKALDPSRSPDPPLEPPLLEFKFGDPDVFQDVNRLLLFCINRSNYAAEKSKMESLLQYFVPEFYFMEPFALPANAPSDTSQGMDIPDNGAALDAAGGADAGSDNEGQAVPARKPPCPIAAVMTRVHRQLPTPALTGTHLFYANGKWFVFHSLYQILYERVWEIKQLSTSIHQQAKAAAATSAAATGNVCPAVALALRAWTDTQTDRYYDTFLDSTERLLANHMDLSAYEEAMRELFTTKSYKICTIDKLIQSTVRQVYTLVGDQISQALAGAYQRSLTAQLNKATTFDYKAEATSLLEDTSVFRMEQKVPRHVTMELLDTDLAETAGDTTPEKWMRYVERYVRL